MKHTATALTLTPVALALLAGCEGYLAPPAGLSALPPTAAPAVADGLHVIPDPMGTEVLTATHVTFALSNSFLRSESFQVQGKASGLLPGTFTARGSWDFGVDNWTFNEQFTVTSGSLRVSGKINANHLVVPQIGSNPAEDPDARMTFGRNPKFGPDAFDYTTKDGAEGRALVEIIKRDSFSEQLSNFTD
jgi:hypothetical protein